MVAILSRLRGRPEVVVECRRCGTNVQRARADCPTCGESDFAEYVIRT